jgi:phosphomannomutase
MVHSLSRLITPAPIQFGTDGWRGVIAADFTFERLYRAAWAAAQVLAEVYSDASQNTTIVVGYDRRFLSETFAKIAATAVQAQGLTPLLAETFAPTPAFSLAAHQQGALGALVITASHNPGDYSGLKIKGAFGGSVPPEVTQKVEALLAQSNWESMVSDRPSAIVPDTLSCATFDPWIAYCQTLRSKVDISAIQQAVHQGQLTIHSDVMHGAAAGGLERLLEVPILELHAERDPLFGGGSPEPLPRNLTQLSQRLENSSGSKPGSESGSELVAGFVFDGDADRIAAMDNTGEFLSSQVLIPILIEHLAVRQGLTGAVIKTVSGSDLMPKVAELYQLPVQETAVGYKYIADQMLTTPVLLGGEESGGIGYGNHIPERDGLLSALYLLEAMVQSGQNLGQLYRELQEKTGFRSAYDRIDLPLASMTVRDRVQAQLQNHPPDSIAGQAVLNCITTDGYKFRLADQRWLMIRFSGTEPLLRLYCEAANAQAVQETLRWAADWASQFEA